MGETDVTSLGGPMYLEVGINEALNHTSGQWVNFNFEDRAVR